MVKQSPTLKVIISGSFKASDGEIESFDNVQGIIPRLSTDILPGDTISKADQMIITRYAPIWIGRERKANDKDAPKYKRVQKVRQVFIDSIDDNDDDGVLDYVGMDVMKMNFEQLQDFAAANDLSAIPRYKVNSLAHARRVAWSEAARKIYGAEGPEFMWTNQAFNPSKHEPIIADGEVRMSGAKGANIEETIDREALALQGKAKANVSDPTQSRLSLDQLKAIADEKKITYSKTIGYEQLYSKIYGTKKVA